MEMRAKALDANPASYLCRQCFSRVESGVLCRLQLSLTDIKTSSVLQYAKALADEGCTFFVCIVLWAVFFPLSPFLYVFICTAMYKVC